MTGPLGWTPDNANGDDVDIDTIIDEDWDSTSEYEAASPRSQPHPRAHIPRPPNAFILFRNNFTRENQRGGPKIRRRPGSAPLEPSLSKRAGNAWGAMSEAEQTPWKEMADAAKLEHKRLYPDYRYQPNKGRSGAGGRRAKEDATGSSQFKRAVMTRMSRRIVSSVSSASSPVSPSFAGTPPLMFADPLSPESASDSLSPKSDDYYRSSSLPPMEAQTLTPTSEKRRSRSCDTDYALNFPFTVSSDFMYYQAEVCQCLSSVYIFINFYYSAAIPPRV